MAVDIAVLKELRALTHAPLKDCKSALEEAEWDLQRAQEVLREKWALKAAKKADRATNEGIVMIKPFGDKIVGLKLACETDFVAKNDTFKWLATQIVEKLSALDHVSDYDSLDDVTKESLNVVLKDNFVTIWENMQILDVFVEKWQWYIYTHPWDKIACVVFYNWDVSLAKNVALQVAAMNPVCLSVEDIPQEDVVKYTEQFNQEVIDSGKPEHIADKIVQWKLQKLWSEIVLLEQYSIIDDSKKIKDMLWSTTVSSYIRYAI